MTETAASPPAAPARFTLGGVLALAASLALVAAALSLAIGNTVARAQRPWTGSTHVSGDSIRVKRSSGLGLGLGVTPKPGQVIKIEPGSPAERAGLRPGDRVLSIDGVPTRRDSMISALAARARPGDTLIYQIARGRDTLDVAVVPIATGQNTRGRGSFVFFGAVALAWWLIGLFVSLRRARDPRAVVFGLACATAAASYLTFPYVSTGMQLDGIRAASDLDSLLLLSLGMIAFTGSLFSALLLHFALIFPHRRPAVREHPEWLQWTYSGGFYPLLGFTAALCGLLASQRHAQWILAPVAALWLGALVPFFRRRIEPGGFRARVFRQPWFSTLILLGGGFLASGGVGVLSRGLRRGAASGLVVLTLLPPALGLLVVPVVFGAITIVALIRSYRESGLEERQQIRWPMWGIVTSMSCTVLFTIVSVSLAVTLDAERLIRFQATLQAVSGFTTLIIPVAFAVGILKYRLMDLDVVIRRTAIYAASLGVLGVLFLILVAGLGGWIGQRLGVQSQVVTSGATVVVALVAVPAFRRVRALLDERFFRARYDAAAVLRRIGDAASQSANAAALGRRVIEELHAALRNRSAALLVRGSGGLAPVAAIGIEQERLDRLSVSLDPAVSGALTSLTHARVSALGGPLADAARLAHADVLVPVRQQATVHGLLAIGTKLSDEDWTAADLEFLAAAAGQVAAGLASAATSGQRRELDEAREIQASLLPSRLPEIPGLDLAAHWQPARQVAGDYYDAFTIEGRGLALCVADVTGKGMPAALLMSNLQATVKALAPGAGGPQGLTGRLNRVLSAQMVAGRFVTFFYAEVEPATRRLRYVNAGHNPPLLLRADGRAEWLDRGGLLLGPLPDASYDEGEAVLAPGDRLVLFTDGITEAEAADRELFGEERLLAAVRDAAGAGADAIQRRLLADVTTHCGGEFQDDATVVVLAVK